MKRIKSAIKIILCCLLCIGTASSLTSCTKKKTEETITRGEWAELLGSFFGMNQPMMDSPYYSDVTSEHPSFLYIQAEKEWELFEDEKEFHPDENATWEFVIKSAVIASGELDSIEDPTERFEQALVYAKEEKLIKNLKKKTLQKEISKEDSVELANWAANHYLDRDFVEYENIEIKEDVLDFSEVENLVVSPVENEETKQRTITDTSGTLSRVKPEDVIIVSGDEENPAGLAQKVVDVEVSDDGKTIITTVEPELQEVFKELDFAHNFVPDLNDVKTEDGFTLLREAAANSSSLALLGAKGISSPSVDLTFYVEKNNKGEMSFGQETRVGVIESQLKCFETFKSTDKTEGFWNTILSSDVSFAIDKLEEWSKQKENVDSVKPGKEIVEAEKKNELVNAGYSLKGKIGIKDFRVFAEFRPKKLFGFPVGIDKILLGIEGEFFSEVDLKGKLETEVKMGEVPVVVQGIVLNIEFFLYVDAKGEVKVKASISNETTIEYNKGRFKTDSKASHSESLEGAITVEPGVGLRGTINVAGIDIVDAALKAGLQAKFSGEIEKETEVELVKLKESDNVSQKPTYKITETLVWVQNMVLNVPVVKLELGKENSTLAHKLGISLKCNVWGEENALLTSKQIDCLKQRGSIGWCQYVSDQGVIYTREYEIEDFSKLDEEILNYDTNKIRIGDQLDIDQYSLYLDIDESKRVQITLLPEGYDIKDITFTMKDSSIAEVDATGKVTATKEGQTHLTIKTRDGKYEITCYISVRAPQMTFKPL